MRTTLVILACGLLLVACGDSATTTTAGGGSSGLDPSAANTCAELADIAIAGGQLLFDYGNAVTGDELAAAIDAIQSGNTPPELEEYVRVTDAVTARQPEVCDGPEFGALFCGGLDDIVSEGDGSNNLLEALYEGCGR